MNLTYEERARIAAEWMIEEQRIQLDKWKAAKAANDWAAAFQHIINGEGLNCAIDHAKAIATGDYSGREPLTTAQRDAMRKTLS